MTQARFIELMQQLTGHSKSFIKQRLRFQGKGSTTSEILIFDSGEFSYYSWVRKGKYIYTQAFLNGQCVLSFYHDLETLKVNWEMYEEDQWEERKYWLDNQ